MTLMNIFSSYCLLEKCQRLSVHDNDWPFRINDCVKVQLIVCLLCKLNPCMSLTRHRLSYYAIDFLLVLMINHCAGLKVHLSCHLQLPAVETMGGLGTNFVTEGFWDYLGGHGKFANWRQCINPDITHQKYRGGCRSLWIAASLAARTILETTLESSIIEFLRMKRYEDGMKSWSVM